MIRFCNSGTEATYHAIRVARAYTKRDKIVKFEGAYHGWHDYASWSVWADPDGIGPPDRPNPVPASAGIPGAIQDTLLILPYIYTRVDNTGNFLFRHARWSTFSKLFGLLRKIPPFRKTPPDPTQG